MVTDVRRPRPPGDDPEAPHGPMVPATGDDSTLVDLLDRVIDRGVVVSGDVMLSVAGVDLVHLGLRLVLRGIDR